MRTRSIASITLALVVGFGLGVWFTPSKEFSESNRLVQDVRDKVASSTFTNPLLECAELPETISIGDRIGLENDIEALIEEKKKEGVITETAVYFRDLNNGPWFGINEDMKFYPASLLKVPLAMWYYSKAENDPAILEEVIEFMGPRGTSLVRFTPRVQLQEGEQYTIEALIQYMLQESDNDAAHILDEYGGRDKSADLYRDLGIILEPSGAIDVHTYASFFRILYNATYIGRTNSEHLLEILSNSSFTEGLRAGVPSEIFVAHKFGEKVLHEGGYQLHDCGIVYAKEAPYSLCIMTQGRDIDHLSDFIRDISAFVYDEVAQ